MPTVCDEPAVTSPLDELQALVERDIPLAAQMGAKLLSWGPEGLTASFPLDKNHNSHRTAFAGSLNALCTLAGWCSVHLLMRELQLAGTIVIRRSSIKYHLPVEDAEVIAHCHPVDASALNYFVEMFREKGQGKLDLGVEIYRAGQPAVVFGGSYVVLRGGEA